MTSFSTMPTPPLSDHHQAPHQSFKDASAADPSSGGVAANAGRKRRAELQPIDLRTCAKSKLISLSSESLNSGNADSDGLQSPSGGENCPGSSTDSEGEEHLKRLCLRSSQSTSPVDFSGLPTIGHRLSPTTVTDEVLPNLAELEGSANNSGGFSSSSTSSRGQLSSGGLLLEDRLLGGHFELVGDGRNCKAVHSSQPESLYHCQIVKLEEFQQVAEIMARMQRVASSYSAEQFALRSNLLLPLDQLRVLRSDQRKELVYLLLPDHHGTLHQLLEENELSDGGGPARLEEGRVQPILKQVALVVEFCHRIGLYFRDFRLRKFVFVDSEKTRIRVNNVLDLYLASEMGCDSVVSREFIPAYVAPEVLDKKNDVYGGAAADIWALGVLMFTLLNGRYPFFEASPSPVALLRRIRAHRFSFPIRASISEPTRWLIHALLCHSPGDRPSAAQLLQAHWFREEGGTAERGGHAETAKDSGPWDRQQQPKTISPPLFLFGRSPSTTPPMALGRASPPTATATTAAQVPSRSQQLQQQHTISNSQSSWGGRGRHPAALEHLTAAGLPLPAGRQQQHQRTASESRQPIVGRPPAFVPIRARNGGIGSNFDLAAEGRLSAFRPTSAANCRIDCAGNERGKQTASNFMAGKQMTKEASEDQVVPDVANNKCH